MKHIMVDLETLGNVNNSVVTAIGAIEFDPTNGTMGESFYQVVDPTGQQEAGLVIEASTVMWWMDQSEEARKAITHPDKGKLGLTQALEEFSAYWKKVSKKNYFWSHATFDAVVLRSAYDVCSIPTPWHYRNVVDIRTMVMLCPKKLKEKLFSIPHTGTHHNALDDAITQAKYISTIYQHITKENK